MARLEIEIEDQPLKWLQETAERNRVTLDEMIELLIKMENGSSMTSRDGRRIKLRPSIYRGYDVYLNDDIPLTGIL